MSANSPHTIFDFIIIGSGPAAVSAAYPLVDAGFKVLMLDAGEEASNAATHPIPQGDFLTLRSEDMSQKNWLVNNRRDDNFTHGSPKLKIPANKHFFARFNQQNHIQSRNFTAIGSLSAGGLSNVWGAGVALFDDEDLQSWPINVADLDASYIRIIERIGVSGSAKHLPESYENLIQPPLKLDSNHQHLLNKYQGIRDGSHASIKLWPSHNAVLSKSLNEREACNYSGMCLWGCQRKSIWNATMEIAQLKKQPNFTYWTGVFVVQLEKISDTWQCDAITERNNERVCYSSKKIILAAGTLSSTRIMLSTLKHYDKPLRLQSNPSAAFMLLLPKHFNAAYENAFGMAQLSYSIQGEQLATYGNLFSASFLPLSEYIEASGLPHRYGKALFKTLLPACVLGNCFIDGKYTQHQISLTQSGELRITGNSEDSDDCFKQVQKSLSRSFRKLGAWMIPKSFTQGENGADIHYASTMAMSHHPNGLQTNTLGEVSGCEGVHIVDGSVLSTLPQKPLTLTIMANADRIAQEVVRKFQA